MASSMNQSDRSPAVGMEAKSSVALDISIKQEPDVEFEEDNQSVNQEPTKRTKEAVVRTTEFFRKLFATRRGQSKIECRKCGQQVKLLTRASGRTKTTHWLRMIGVRGHAITHVNKLMYSCLHCGQTFTNLVRTRDHTTNFHHKCPLNYSDFSDSYEKEIFEMAEECFGEKLGGTDDNNPIKVQHAIKQYFARLYQTHWKNQTRINCNLCGLGLTVRNPKGKQLRSYIAIFHAAMHMEKFLFSCRQCLHQFVSHRAVLDHLRNHHALGGHPGNYVNRMHEYKNELIDVFERCYAKAEQQQPMGGEIRAMDPEAIRTSISENTVRFRGGSNTCFTERQLHCRRLMVQYVKQGSIKCRVCSHLVNVKQSGGGVSNQHAIWHATTHMEKILYKCKICGEDIRVMSSVYRHMKKEHAITKGVTKEFDDRSNELHTEILDALTRSFDWTGEDWSAKK